MLLHWIRAARLRTLPLAVATVLAGSTVARQLSPSGFDYPVFALTLLTTILLQILSNFANDYGDGVKGTDALRTHGNARAVQSGWITARQMKTAIVALAILCLLSGIALLIIALGNNWASLLSFLLVGLAAIAAAILYTVGPHAYGYRGLGDVMVFLFFGWVGVVGTAWLQVKQFLPAMLLPAFAVGLLATAVLNLNNLRDLEDDQKAGKITIPVRLGFQNGLLYHHLLVLAGCGSWLLHALSFNSLFFQCATLLPAAHLFLLSKHMPRGRFNKLLPLLAMSILLVSMVGWMLG